MIKRYRKRPVVIETVEWTGENIDEMWNFTGIRKFRTVTPARGLITGEVWDELHSTWIGLKTGDLVIKGLKGEFYPHDKDTMPLAYEEVER